MTYNILKWIHVVTATLWASGVWGLLRHRNQVNPPLWPSICLCVALLLQPISGFSMIMLRAHAFPTLWTITAWSSYGLTLIGSLWLLVTVWQKQTIKWPFIFTLIGVLSALWVMTAPPP
ncbi:MAG: hypothetical protein A3J38_10250 [Gammaproteobacteria bacterium RIFCSPHIGHO2_12_FULL_45_9]|nr:MAG: hypothetical protein A3J38_10250 [Gammaproteobacteria bacterium RIFCSPHIGHO2_12_FULL_45_9]